MANAYRPRRQSARWLDGDCPKEVLAIYDNGGTSKRGGSFDRYTIFYVPPRGYEVEWIPCFFASEFPYSPTGFGVHDDMKPHVVAAYRFTFAHQATAWTDLPLDVQRCVRDDCEALRGA